MSVVQNSWRVEVQMFNNKHFSVNSVRFQQFESFRCCSLATVRYVAQAARVVCVTYLVEYFLSTGFSFYERRTDLEVGCFL